MTLDNGPTGRRRRLPRLAGFLCGSVLAFGAGAAGAQTLHTFEATASGVIGGAFDVDGEDPGLGQTGFQLGFSWDTWDRTRVGVRVARVAFSDELLEQVFDPELTYVTLAGEYRFEEAFYTSGLYLGVGLYQVDGEVGGVSDDDTSPGLVIGVTGDFPLTERFSILVDLSGHYADLELGAQLFGFLSAGLSYHF